MRKFSKRLPYTAGMFERALQTRKLPFQTQYKLCNAIKYFRYFTKLSTHKQFWDPHPPLSRVQTPNTNRPRPLESFMRNAGVLQALSVSRRPLEQNFMGFGGLVLWSKWLIRLTPASVIIRSQNLPSRDLSREPS